MRERKKFSIIPLDYANRDEVGEYWAKIQEARLLRFRLSNISDPGLKDVWETMAACHRTMFFVQGDGGFLAEFTLDNFTGKAAQVHFSMNPSNTFRDSIIIAASVTNTVLSEWKKEEDSEEGDYLDTLYGLTPMLNRSACLFALKSGFKKIGVLPSGASFEGNACDGMLSIKTKGRLPTPR